jgi:hypothetical protein
MISSPVIAYPFELSNLNICSASKSNELSKAWCS